MFLFDILNWKFHLGVRYFGGSSGGGSSGDISYPQYLSDIHNNWLTGNAVDDDEEMTYSITELMDTAHGAGGNPYEGETAYNPNAAISLLATSPLGKMNSQFVASKAIIDALDAETDWKSYVTAAGTKLTSFSSIDFLDSLSTAISGLLTAVDSALSNASLTNMVTAFENNKKTRFLRDTGIWAAGMADINAVHTSSFIMGLAIQQIEFSNSVDQYERELKASVYNKLVAEGFAGYIKAEVLRVGSEDSMLLTGPDVMGKIENMKTQAQLQLANIKAEIERMMIVATKEQKDRQVELEVDEATWDMEVYMYGANVLGSIAGASAGRKTSQMSKGQTALGGAMAGASVGAAFGPWGAAAGFLAGGLLGWLF